MTKAKSPKATAPRVATYDYVGQVVLVPVHYTPAGYFPCDGSAFDIARFQSLYESLGTNIIPAIPSPSPTHHYVINWSGVFPSNA